MQLFGLYRTHELPFQHSLYEWACSGIRIKWRMGISRLQTTKFPFSIKICISQFVRGLPFIPAFTPLHADIPYRIATAGDQDFRAFISLTEVVLELDTIFHTSSHAQVPRSSRTLNAPVPAPSASTPQTISSSNAPDATVRVPKQCNNCKTRGLRFVGHTDGTCFQQGGGMEGHREEISEQ